MKIIIPLLTFTIGLVLGIFSSSNFVSKDTPPEIKEKVSANKAVVNQNENLNNKETSNLSEPNQRGESEVKTGVTRQTKFSVKDQQLDPIEIRLSAINKIVGLTADEEMAVKDLLTEGQSHPFTLEDIIGSEKANFYYQQQRASFNRSENEEIEKDLYFFSRRFGLDHEQESAVINILTEIKDQNKTNRGGSPARMGATPQERLKEILNETRIYRNTLKERLKSVLSEQQYQAFLAYDAESVAADMQMWHDTGDE
jgi:hypothetical protein